VACRTGKRLHLQAPHALPSLLLKPLAEFAGVRRSFGNLLS